MATAAEINRMMLWTDLEGTLVADRWRIERLVRPEGRMAWFEATTAEGSPLMLSITETLNDDDELLARLHSAAEICHPNLVRVLDSVASCIDESPVVIAAMERTEENLDDVLRERPLTAREAQLVLEALVQGTAAIHARGLVHARMEPSSVLAQGDTIKLRADCLHLPESGFSAAAAANVVCIGRIVTRAMTRRDPLYENDPVLQLLPEPMARAVRRALSGHARVDEIAGLGGIRIIPATEPRPEIRQPAPLMIAVTPAQEAKGDLASQKSGEEPSTTSDPANPPGQASGTGAAKAVAAIAAPGNPDLRAGNNTQGADSKPDAPLPGGGQPAGNRAESQQPSLFQVAEPPRDLSHLIADDDESVSLWRKPGTAWVLGGAAGVLLITIFTLFALLHRSPAPAVPAEPKIVTEPMRATVPKPSLGSNIRTAATAPRTAAQQAGWRVIVWTYDREADAQHKVDTLAKKYPRLNPGVFSLRGRAPYLVTLGGVMTREQAFAVRSEALRLGMPRDTYAQNYR